MQFSDSANDFLDSRLTCVVSQKYLASLEGCKKARSQGLTNFFIGNFELSPKFLDVVKIVQYKFRFYQ